MEDGYIRGVIPAVDGIRRYKEFLESGLPACVLMNVHLSLLDGVFRSAREREKKIILHVDRINGLSDDEYGAEYVSQKYAPAGAISIKPAVIAALKKKRVTAIQRIFLIDSFALARSAEAVKNASPDFVEVMPGMVPDLVPTLKAALGKELIAGGLIPDLAAAEELLKSFRAVTMSFPKVAGREGKR